MSAAAVDPGNGPQPDFDWQGAVTSALMGGAAMLARLLTMERASGWFIARSAFVASVASYFVGMGTKHLFTPEQVGLWIVTVGLAGFGSPELITLLIKNMPAILEKASSAVGLKPAKANAKRPKGKRRR